MGTLARIPYDEFIDTKRMRIPASGFDAVLPLNPMLKDFQFPSVRWGLQRGKAAFFWDCGTGKTFTQLEVGRHVAHHTDAPSLILAPLAVAQQTVREGEKFGIPVTICRSQADVRAGINISNYEMLGHFNADAFASISLDESSILKGFGGVLRKEITEFGSTIPYRFCYTATPAPNDYIEICNHSEFLGLMTGKEIIALFFTQDGNTTHKWRLKAHAKKAFYEWLATWAMALRKPSDIGFSDEGYILPPLTVTQHTTEGTPLDGMLFPIEALTLQERQGARRTSIGIRVEKAKEIVNATPEPWVIWCGLNAEQEALEKVFGDRCISIYGSLSPDEKSKRLMAWLDGQRPILLSKCSITGFGINMQFCHNMMFFGLSDSWEEWYQGVRRCWRYGQEHPVNVHVVTAETEGAVVANIQRKERQAGEMMDELVEHMASLSLGKAERIEDEYQEADAEGKGWKVMLGDTVKRMDDIASDSVGLTITSPPFPGMYAYSNSSADIGNTETINQMIEHFRYVVDKDHLLRVTMPGRRVCVHLMQLTAMLSRDGYIGIKDYRGRVIQMMEEEGWIYFGEATIDKNPQVQAVRNKERGLLFKTLATDSSLTRMALADYLLYFIKPGVNPEPIKAGISKKYNPGGGWVGEAEWIEMAGPVWRRHTKDVPGGIRETNVLNVREAKETDEERHLCPLQMDVIEWATRLWSNPGDLVFDPFNGVGSTGVGALQLKRRYVGTELKRSYWLTACKNLRKAEHEIHEPTLFDMVSHEQEEEEIEEVVAS